VWREKIKEFQKEKVWPSVNIVEYHPEELDSCLASELLCDAELSFPRRGGSGPAVGVRAGWFLARRWDPGAWVFLLLEKTENCTTLVPG